MMDLRLIFSREMGILTWKFSREHPLSQSCVPNQLLIFGGKNQTLQMVVAAALATSNAAHNGHSQLNQVGIQDVDTLQQPVLTSYQYWVDGLLQYQAMEERHTTSSRMVLVPCSN